MFAYLIRRAGFSMLGLLVVSLLVLELLSLAPGDAASIMVGDAASAEELASLRTEMKLGVAVPKQWATYWENLLLRGDLGTSLFTGRPVLTELLERGPYTLILAVSSMALALLAGVAVGLLAALRRGSWWDVALMGSTTLGIAVPSFWLALLLIMVFSLGLRWLPVTGADGPLNLILPAICLALPAAASIARLTRTNVLDVLGSDYVLVARAKGLAPGAVVWRHLLRNSLIPTVTVAGMQFGHLLGGAFIVETIFAWPGLGRLAVRAVFNRDWPIIMGTSVAMAATYIGCNFVVDVLYSWLDPRIGHQSV